MTVIYEKLMNEIEALIQVYKNKQRYLTNTTQAASLHSVLEAMTQLRKSHDITTGINIINKVSVKQNIIVKPGYCIKTIVEFILNILFLGTIIIFFCIFL